MVRTRLEISSTSQPFAKDIPVSIDFVLADVREPDKRNASFSKTIELYATNEINKLFENIFEVNIATQYFNKNKKTAVKYFVDEILNFEGNLQLIKIKLNPDNLIVYECSIVGESGNLFIDIGDKYIIGNADSTEDLDFSAYDHTFNGTTQRYKNTHNVGTGTDCVYPFIDKGSNGGSDTVFRVEDFMPCFSAYEYIKKIIEKTGRTFTSTTLNTTDFKNIIVYPNLQSISLSTTQLANRQFNVGLSADITVTNNIAAVAINHTNTSTGGYFDIGGQSVGTTVTLNNGGYYNFAALNYYSLTFTHTDVSVTYAVFTNTQVYVGIDKSSNGGVSYFPLTNDNRLWNNTLVNQFNKGTAYYFNNSVASGSAYFSGGDKFQQTLIVTQGTVQYYNASNVLVTTGTGTITYKLISGTAKTSFYALASDKTLTAGNTIEVNNALPIKIKQKDFFKSIIQAFNLYVDIDKNDKNNVIIETYDEFYNSAIINYENRTDLDKEQSINPNLLEGKRYIYTYKEDGDYWNTLYKTNWNEVFGTETQIIDNDFIKSDKKNELIFSATPNVANYGLGIAHPRIYKQEQSGGVVAIKPITPNIRLLYCGGIKQTINAYTYKDSSASDIVTNDYLYAGHTDDWANPTIDLNFGLPKEVFYTYPNAYFTTNNLFNAYHKNYLNNIVDKDSKFVTKYLWLNSKDINEFNFRHRWFIDGAYYVVNKIVNYNPLNETSTQVELIKLLETNVFTPSTISIKDTAIQAGIKNEAMRLNSALNLGTGISNRAANSLAIGNNIVIPESASNVMIMGNNITVAENATNFTYNNGAITTTVIGDSKNVKLVTANYNIKAYDDTILANATSGNITVTLMYSLSSYLLANVSVNVNGINISSNITKVITIMKTDSSVNTVTIDGYGVNINGSATKVLSTQYDSATLQYDGANWVILK
jgi:hypothetical protein